jgi:2-aminoethylphosphonate-pyruvate transaminase
MTSPVQSAVILAAGMGLRLEELGTRTPKGFLRLGERALVEESLERLVAAGIERVVVVTGHLRDFYEDLRLARADLVTTVHNPRFADSGSLRSLWCARELLDEDFLLLESDIVYEPRALDELLAHPAADVVLVSGPTGAGDEVWVETADGRLVDMSKDRGRLGRAILGELVGITKVSQGLFSEMLRVAERLFRETLKVDYETDGLVQAGRARPIACHLVPDLVWAEIDDERALERARTLVYPRLAQAR